MSTFGHNLSVVSSSISGMMHYASFFVTARMYAFGLHTTSFLMFQTASLSIFWNALVQKWGVHLQNL